MCSLFGSMIQNIKTHNFSTTAALWWTWMVKLCSLPGRNNWTVVQCIPQHGNFTQYLKLQILKQVNNCSTAERSQWNMNDLFVGQQTNGPNLVYGSLRILTYITSWWWSDKSFKFHIYWRLLASSTLSVLERKSVI